MKFHLFYILFTLLSLTNGFSQKIIKHKVVKGESLFAIAKKYHITQAEVIELNPKYKNGILKLNEVIEIPNKNYKEEKAKRKDKKIVETKANLEPEINTNNQFIIHTVLKKETIYSISKKYNISMELLCETNEELKTTALKLGSKIKIPNNNSKITIEKLPEVKSNPVLITEKIEDKVANNLEGTVIHKVQPKETLYKISRDFKVNVKVLEELNPTIKNSLPVGYNLIIKKGNGIIINNQPEVATNSSTEKPPTFIDNAAKADYLIAKASQNIGVNYRSGGTTTSGFDCSGFMFATFKEIDLVLPRTSHEQASYGYKIDKSQAQKGDLIFFSTNGNGSINHVGMVIEVLPDEIKFIHSSSSNGVMVSSTNEEYYAKRFRQISRVLSE